ncbi:hypothetical protein [Kribbella sp. VKM Ac-2571]|uniref:hypothetical protein n=1 Tax=Kribbella sp. VKM Ac-2571 TaxID=2512222 RepID=UPI00105DFAFB|nr:hypothetical protein [Kribbella sp. VKM Ac-2571]
MPISPKQGEPVGACQVPVRSGAVMSADGRRIAYVLTTVDEDADAYHRAIWTIDADGGTLSPAASVRDRGRDR